VSGRTSAALIASLALGLCGLGAVSLAQGPQPALRPGLPPAVPAPVTPPAIVKIQITTVPTQKKVFVSWGKKRLGIVEPHHPLIVQRPRDSGPLDLLITCEGFVPVQTRAYTFGDSKLAVKLTPLDQKNTLLGYRAELPPEPPPDAGAPGTPPPPPPTPLPPGVVAPPRGPADAGAR
jgi:hypothetical protein